MFLEGVVKMYLKNPFRMKDWRIKEFLLLIIAIQVMFSMLLFLDYAGLNIPIIKDVVGFILILFVPGILLLRLLDLDGIRSNGHVLLYTVGLSLSALMLVGFLMNAIYPLFGIDKPLSFTSIFITINSFIFILCLLCYQVDKRRRYKLILRNLKDMVIKKSPPNHVDLKNLLTLPLVFPLFIPVLSILGAYMMNVYQSNILTILMIFSIGLIAFLVGTGRFIPSKLYSLSVFVISISLLLHKSLITNYIWGWDINFEYFLVNQVISNSFWNQNLPINYNSMLSVMILAPILSSFINTGLIWVMKIVYPFIFSLMPLGLYYIFYKQTSSRIAFFASFFFMLQLTFYTEMLALVRQQVAELMLVLVLMIMINEQLNVTKRSILAIIFGLSIIVAHYGLAYIMMIILLISILTLYILDKNPNKVFNRFLTKIYQINVVNTVISHFSDHLPETIISGKDMEYVVGTKIKQYRSVIKKSRIVLTPPFIALFMLFLLIWYIYTSNSTIFQSFIDIGSSIIDNISSFMDPSTTQGLSLVMEEQTTPLRNLHKNFYLVSQAFIAIGVLALLFGKDGMKFKKEFKALSLAAFIVLIAGVVLPFFSSQMNTTRLYHVALIVLAPFGVLGIIKIVNLFKLFLKFKLFSRINLSQNYLFTFISIFFVVFLFFNTGLVYQFLDSAHPTSIALNASLDFPKFNQREVTGGEWLEKYSNNTVYADKYRASVLGSMVSTKEIPAYYDLVDNESYMYLGTVNIARNQILTYQMTGANIVMNEGYQSPAEILKGRSKIYDDGGSYIYGTANVYKSI